MWQGRLHLCPVGSWVGAGPAVELGDVAGPSSPSVTGQSRQALAQGSQSDEWSWSP